MKNRNSELRMRPGLRLRRRLSTYPVRFFLSTSIFISISFPMRPTGNTRAFPAPAIAYDEHRAEINNGDVLMYRGKSLESRVIQWAIRSRYSHAGLAAWWNDKLMVMEAVGKGVVTTPLSSNVLGYRGDVEWFTPVEPIPEEDRLRLVEFAQRELGKEYALWKALLLGLRILFQHGREKRDRLRREGQLFCSHYVAEAYNAIGRDLKKGVSDRFMSPGDIADSPLLRRVGALKKRDARHDRGFRRGEIPATSGSL